MSSVPKDDKKRKSFQKFADIFRRKRSTKTSSLKLRYSSLAELRTNPEASWANLEKFPDFENSSAVGGGGNYPAVQYDELSNVVGFPHNAFSEVTRKTSYRRNKVTRHVSFSSTGDYKMNNSAKQRPLSFPNMQYFEEDISGDKFLEEIPGEKNGYMTPPIDYSDEESCAISLQNEEGVVLCNLEQNLNYDKGKQYLSYDTGDLDVSVQNKNEINGEFESERVPSPPVDYYYDCLESLDGISDQENPIIEIGANNNVDDINDSIVSQLNQKFSDNASYSANEENNCTPVEMSKNFNANNDIMSELKQKFADKASNLANEENISAPVEMSNNLNVNNDIVIESKEALTTPSKKPTKVTFSPFNTEFSLRRLNSVSDLSSDEDMLSDLDIHMSDIEDMEADLKRLSYGDMSDIENMGPDLKRLSYGGDDPSPLNYDSMPLLFTGLNKPETVQPNNVHPKPPIAPKPLNNVHAKPIAPRPFNNVYGKPMAPRPFSYCFGEAIVRDSDNEVIAEDEGFKGDVDFRNNDFNDDIGIRYYEHKDTIGSLNNELSFRLNGVRDGLINKELKDDISFRSNGVRDDFGNQELKDDMSFRLNGTRSAFGNYERFSKSGLRSAKSTPNLAVAGWIQESVEIANRVKMRHLR